MMRLLAVVALIGCGGSKPAPAPIVGSSPPAHEAPAKVEALALAIDVYRWSCTVHYDELEMPELAVPRGRPLHLTFASRDINHDVTFSTGQTVHVPGHATATLDLTLDGPATVLCPVDAPPQFPDQTKHPVEVLEPAAYARWLADTREAEHPTTIEGKVALGAKLADHKGCLSCHTTDGPPRVGPTWKGSWGTKVIGADGSTRVFDASYVRESIETPQKFARPAYPPTMPSFEGVLKDIEIESLAAYIESLR